MVKKRIGTIPLFICMMDKMFFYSSEAYSGYSWKVIPAIKRNPDLPKMIIVGIDNGEQDRINEYTPWKITESPLPEDIELGGRGAEFAEFIMTVVKPFIDQHYRTKSDKYHTAMIGSSLGGNISAFMGIEYKDQIGCLGIFFTGKLDYKHSF